MVQNFADKLKILKLNCFVLQKVVSMFLGLLMPSMNLNEIGYSILIGWTLWLVVLCSTFESLNKLFVKNNQSKILFYILKFN